MATSTKPKVLDLFCGAGGCSMGYSQAGFEVVGVDIKPMPRYPFRFILGDALEVLVEMIESGEIEEYSLIASSPPCQKYTNMGNVWKGKEYPDLVAATRTILIDTGLPYVIENVEGARDWLINPILLCGSMFGLRVYRHRLFECNPWLLMPPHIAHQDSTPKAGRGTASPKGFISVAGHFSNVEYAKEAMGIDWMVRDELSQAIPPAYTQWLGCQMLEMVKVS